MTQHDDYQDVLQQLELLEPSAADQPLPVSEALTHFHQSLPPVNAAESRISSAIHKKETLFDKAARRLKDTMSKRQKQQRLAISGVMIALIAGILILPGARAAASEFLGLFRVQKFAPISVSPEQLARLENMDIDGLYPGEFEWIEEPDEPVAVDSIDQLYAQTEQYANTFGLQDVLGEPQRIEYGGEGSAAMTINLEGARAILELAEVDPNLLPDSLDGADISVSTSNAVMMEWEDGIVLIQTPSPEISYPDNFDPADIGYALLQVLGMPEEEAYRLSQSIDWTNTLIMPIPQDLATFSEVSIAGSPGILISAVDGSHSTIMWEGSFQVYVLSNNGDADALLSLAESMR